MNKFLVSVIVFISSHCVAEWTELETGKEKLISHKDQAGFLLLTEQGNTHIEVLDKDSDGVVDLIRLSVFNEQNQEIIQVEDSNLDGIIDHRWYRQEPSYVEMHYEGAWYKVEKSDSESYIETENGKLLLTNKNGYLQVQTDSK